MEHGAGLRVSGIQPYSSALIVRQLHWVQWNKLEYQHVQISIILY